MNECHVILAFKRVVFQDLLSEVRHKNEMQNNAVWDSVTNFKTRKKDCNLSSSQHHIPCICKLLSLPGAFDANSHNREKNKESPHVHGIQPPSQILLHKISLIHKISLFRWYLEGQYTNSRQICRCYE